MLRVSTRNASFQHWQALHGSAPSDQEPLTALSQPLCQVLPDHAVIALCARERRISFGRPLAALERLPAGHRAAFLGRVRDLRAAW